MNDRSPPTQETPAASTSQEPDGGLSADLPLAVLESVRDHDRPTEVLEEEDLASSLPRRLGLTGVVESQIHRYKLARKRRERIAGDEVADLLRLVLRRPDVEAILREAGRDLARDHNRRIANRVIGLARFLPDLISVRVARGRVRRLLRRIGGTPVRVSLKPFRVEVTDAITARAHDDGAACVLFSAAIEEVFQHAAGRRAEARHPECQGRGGNACAWELD